MQFLFKEKITEVIRTRDESIITQADIVFDVGNIYDPEHGRFDHHQTEGAGTRENGVPYASFGLVWKKYGTQICGSQEIADSIDKKIDSLKTQINLITQQINLLNTELSKANANITDLQAKLNELNKKCEELFGLLNQIILNVNLNNLTFVNVQTSDSYSLINTNTAGKYFLITKSEI